MVLETYFSMLRLKTTPHQITLQPNFIIAHQKSTTVNIPLGTTALQLLQTRKTTHQDMVGSCLKITVILIIIVITMILITDQ